MEDGMMLLSYLDTRFVFIAPPSIDALRERLTKRGTESPESLEGRLRNARAERNLFRPNENPKKREANARREGVVFPSHRLRLCIENRAQLAFAKK
jgi:hypothetical protein